MSFDRRDIRKTMDVYSYDNVYLGTVLVITEGPARRVKHSIASDPSSYVNGELLGPMPTQPIGSEASMRQGAGAHYGIAADAAPIGAGSIVVGRCWGLRQRRIVALDDVQCVSLERIVLKQRAAELSEPKM